MSGVTRIRLVDPAFYRGMLSLLAHHHIDHHPLTARDIEIIEVPRWLVIVLNRWQPAFNAFGYRNVDPTIPHGEIVGGLSVVLELHILDLLHVLFEHHEPTAIEATYALGGHRALTVMLEEVQRRVHYAMFRKHPRRKMLSGPAIWSPPCP